MIKWWMLFLYCSSVQAQLTVTNHTVIATGSDSFGTGIYAQRQNFFVMSFYINMYPQFVISPRDYSRSGADNLEMLTNRIQKIMVQEAALCTGVTNLINFMYVSGNHATGDHAADSNTIRTDFLGLVQFPDSTYTRFNLLTNDPPIADSSLHVRNVVIGDVAYHAAVPNTLSRDYSYGGRTVALANGLTYVDSYVNTSNAVATAYGIDANGFWFNAPSYDHPANEIQMVWGSTTLRSLGEDTNVFTVVLNASAVTVTTTNHCTVPSLLKVGNNLTFTLHVDRMGMSYYAPDSSQTNDCRGGLALESSILNNQCEIIRIQNLVAGTYSITQDGAPFIPSITSTQLAAGTNTFWVNAGALWLQKKQTLNLLCDYANVSRTNASDPYQPTGNQLWFKWGSYASTVWPTNSPSVVSYITQSDMVARNTEMLIEDHVVNTDVQQTNHTFVVTLQALAGFNAAPFGR